MLEQKHPEQVVDLLAYSSLIVKASKDYEDTPWLNYDQHYRRHAAAKHGELFWTEIWTLYFSCARAKPHCTVCGESGHVKCDGAGGPSANEAVTPIL